MDTFLLIAVLGTGFLSIAAIFIKDIVLRIRRGAVNSEDIVKVIFVTVALFGAYGILEAGIDGVRHLDEDVGLLWAALAVCGIGVVASLAFYPIPVSAPRARRK